MKLIKQLKDNVALQQPALSEDSAGGGTGAGGVAMMAMPLFSTLVQQTRPGKKLTVKKIKYATTSASKKPTLGLAEAYKALTEEDMPGGTPSPAGGGDQKIASTQQFDTSQIISKLKGLERREQTGARDVVTFGLEDDESGIVRVTIKQEQAQEFEQALSSMIAQREDDEGQVPEIAEILFKLKDHFDIVDVKWPDVAEDEEEQINLDGGDEAMSGEGDAPPDGMDVGMDPPSDDGAPAQAADLLTQVIDMMKADAEARKAEARAREAEANTKQADAIVAQTMSRVKQEEQYLDMETHHKAQKEQDKEAKRLAQLAKWKSDMSQGGGGMDDDQFQQDAPLQPNRDAVPEEEEHTRQRPRSLPAQPARRAAPRGRMMPHDIAQFIIGRVS